MAAGADPGPNVTSMVIGNVDIGEITKGVDLLKTAMQGLETSTGKVELDLRKMTSYAAEMGVLAANAEKLAVAMTAIAGSSAGAAARVLGTAGGASGGAGAAAKGKGALIVTPTGDALVATGGGATEPAAARATANEATMNKAMGRYNTSLIQMAAAGTLSPAQLTRAMELKTPGNPAQFSMMASIGHGYESVLRTIDKWAAPTDEMLARVKSGEVIMSSGINPRDAWNAMRGNAPLSVAEIEARAQFGVGGARDRANAVVEHRMQMAANVDAQAAAGYLPPLPAGANDRTGGKFFGAEAPVYPQGHPRAGQINRAQWRTNAVTDMTQFISTDQATRLAKQFNDAQMQAFSESEAGFLGSVEGLRQIPPARMSQLTPQEKLDAIQMQQVPLAANYPNVLTAQQQLAQELRVARENAAAAAPGNALGRQIASTAGAPSRGAQLAALQAGYNAQDNAEATLAKTELAIEQAQQNAFSKAAKQQERVLAGAAGSGGGRGGKSAGGMFEHGLTRGLFMYPGFMLAQYGIGMVGSALGAMAGAQTADTTLAWTEGYDSAENPLVVAQAAAAQRVGASMGYKPADITNTYTESYRLTHDQPSALAITRAVATMSRLTGTDPATTQSEIAPIYKALGVDAAKAMPDILARGAQLYDVPPAQLEQTVAKAVTIASMIGIDKKSQNEDLAFLTSASAALEQDVNLSPGSAQSALRMFATNLRNPTKETSKTLAKLGFAGIGQMSMAQAYDELAQISQRDPAKATSIVETLSGTRSGLFNEDIVKHLSDINANTKQMAQAIGSGLGGSYAAAQINSTMAGQMSQLEANFQRMFANPNAGPTKLFTGALAWANSAVTNVNDSGTLDALTKDLQGNKYITQQAMPFWGPILDGVDTSKAMDAMYKDMVKKIEDPNTPATERASLVATYNQLQHDMGNLQTYAAVQQGGRPGAAHAAGASGRTWTSPGHAPLSTRAGQAAELSRRLGLPEGVMRAWLDQENGPANNPLNIMGKNGIMSFKSTADAIDYTTHFLTDYDKAGYYTKIFATANAGGSPQDIMRAIGASPFDAGHYREDDSAGRHENTSLPAGYDLARNYARYARLDKNGQAPSQAVGDPLAHYFGQNTVTQAHGGAEAGVDFVPKDQKIKLPVGGRFLAKYSTPFASMFQGADGKFQEITHISPQRFKDGQWVDAGTVVGSEYPFPMGHLDPISGKWVPGDSVAALAAYDKAGHHRHNAYSSTGAHIEYGVFSSADDAFMYQNGLDPVNYLRGAASAPVAPQTQAQQVAAITHNQKYAAEIVTQSAKMGVDPLTFLAFMRTEFGYTHIPKGESVEQIAAIFAKHAGTHDGATRGDAHDLLADEFTAFRNAANAGAFKVDPLTRKNQTESAMNVLRTWAAFDASGNSSGNPYSLIGAQQSAGPAQQAAAATAAQTQIDLLSALVDQGAANNGYLSKMANFNTPSGYGIPVWEAWAARTGSSPAPHTSAAHPSSGGAHRTAGAHRNTMGNGARGGWHAVN